MSRSVLALGTIASMLGTTALSDAPNVATDIAPVHSLAARVMDGVGTPDLIIAQGASPHEYSLRPSEASALQEADVVFWIGEDLTPWLGSSIETLAGDAAIVELLEAEGVQLLDFRESALFEAHDHSGHDDHDHADHDEHGHDDHDHADHDEHGHDDHDHADHDEHGHDDHDHADHDDHGHDDHDHAAHDDHGHDDHDDHAHDDHAGHDGHHHGDHDPHAWLSPANATVWLNTIAATLSATDPENAGAYYANAAAAKDELAAVSAQVEATLAPLRGGRFVVFHDAYQYFETAFDFPASGAISLSDASDPSPARIAEIQGRVANEGISCVLSEPQFNPGLVATVMEGTEAKTSVLDPLGTSLALGPDLYPQLLQDLADALAECL